MITMLNEPINSTVTHISGIDVTVQGRYLRQRCGWCGAILIDYDLTRIATIDGKEPATWTPGSLIDVSGLSPIHSSLNTSKVIPDTFCGHVETGGYPGCLASALHSAAKKETDSE